MLVASDASAAKQSQNHESETALGKVTWKLDAGEDEAKASQRESVASPRGAKPAAKPEKRAVAPQRGGHVGGARGGGRSEVNGERETQAEETAGAGARAQKRKSVAGEGAGDSTEGEGKREGKDGKEKEGGRQGRWKLECEKMLGRLMRQEKAWPFLQPVDPVALGLPDYFNIIKEPMDLGTVKEKLEAGRYVETREVLNDVSLTLRNAMIYNPEKDLVWKLAKSMKDIFLSLVNGSEILRSAPRDVEIPDGQGDKRPSSQPGSPRPVQSPRPAQKESASKEPAPKKEVPVKVEAPAPRKNGEKEGAAKSTHAGVGGARGVGSGERVKQTANVGSKDKKPEPTSRGDIEEEEKRTYSLTIRKKGRAWGTPPRHLKGGGDWLIGRHIRVFWDMEDRWFVGIVTFYDGRPDAEDSHGATGPVHDVYYEDGSYWENLTTAQWQYDTNEGNAGVAVDLLPGMKKRKASSKVSFQGLSVENGDGKASAASAKAAASPRPTPSPSTSKVQALRGVKQDSKPDGSLKELEYEVVYAPGKSNWTTALQKEGNFRTLLLGFIDKAFPDRSVLHPWMPDFKKNVWEWGYREHKLQEEGGRKEGGDADCLGVNGVCMADGKTQYRCAQANQRHRWETVGPSTSPRVHKLASSFLFSSIGVISVHMGREKHAKFLRHLAVYEEYAKGWEAYGRGERREDLEKPMQPKGGSASMYAEEHDGNPDGAAGPIANEENEEADDENRQSARAEIKSEAADGGQSAGKSDAVEAKKDESEEGRPAAKRAEEEKDQQAEQRKAWLVSLGAEAAAANEDASRGEMDEGEGGNGEHVPQPQDGGGEAGPAVSGDGEPERGSPGHESVGGAEAGAQRRDASMGGAREVAQEKRAEGRAEEEDASEDGDSRSEARPESRLSAAQDPEEEASGVKAGSSEEAAMETEPSGRDRDAAPPAKETEAASQMEVDDD